MHKVSICIPSYGQPEKTLRCIQSILRQTYTDFEVLISDDTEDDSVLKVIRFYLDDNPIQYFHNSPAKGSPENWNEAMRKATGDLIMVMHHDDWFFLDTSLEDLITHLFADSADMAFAQSYNIDGALNILSKNDPDPRKLRFLRKDTRNIFYYNYIGAPSAVLFRNRGVLFDTRLKWLVDIEFYIRYLGEGRITYVPESVIAIGIDSNQMTHSCYGNADVELKENMLVFSTLKHSVKYWISDLFHFFRLFMHLGIEKADIAKYSLQPRFIFLYHICSCILKTKRFAKILLRW